MSHAAVFVCPSLYELFGLVNLEAMACEAPVVASAVGGIPGIVRHGETVYLVPVEPGAAGAPADPARFADLAARFNELLADPGATRSYGESGRRRVDETFGWRAVASRTAELYARLLAGRRTKRRRDASTHSRGSEER